MMQPKVLRLQSKIVIWWESNLQVKIDWSILEEREWTTLQR